MEGQVNLKMVGAVLCFLGGVSIFVSWSLRARGWSRLGLEATLVLASTALLAGIVCLAIGVLLILLGRGDTHQIMGAHV